MQNLQEENIINNINKNLAKLNLKIKFPYKNIKEYKEIFNKICKPILTNAEKYKLSFEVDNDSIYIKRRKKIVAIFDNYITDITNSDEFFEDTIFIKEKNKIKKYRLGIVNGFDGFVYQDNKRKGNRIIKQYIEKYYYKYIV